MLRETADMATALPQPETVEIETADGFTLRCRRYRRQGSRAVVCGHGQASNGYQFDLPLFGFSVAKTLYELGYEVWIVNFRGAGHPPWQSDGGDWRFSGDQMGALDLPAVIDRVVEETGMPPFYIGHSFGGMSLYIYLQGVVLEGEDFSSIRRDPEVARERNKKIAAALTAGSPVGTAEGVLDTMERVRRHPWVQAIAGRLVRFLVKRSARKPLIPIGEMSIRFGFRHPWLARLIMYSPLMKMYMQPKKMGRMACGVFGTWGGGNVTCLHVAQAARTIITGGLASMDADGGSALVYADGMPDITVPIAAAAGTKDFMRPVDIEESVLDAVASEHTLLLPIQGCGHIDMVYHLPLAEVMGWMEWATR
jgi:pimeloyl-ACP methyl ester carboxylesterase